MSTIKDVAKYAGVSIATVSRVINQASNVQPKTVEKVNEAIRACNFVPNMVARNLKSEQTKTIGFLVSDIANSYFTIMAKTLETNLRRQGYDMLICSTDDNPEKERSYLKHFLGSQVAGMILNTTGKNNQLIEEISQTVPIVLVERTVELSGFRGDFVGADNYSGIYELTTCLLENGHRRVAIVNGNLDVSTGYERYLGFVDAMKEYGILVDEKYPYRFDTNHFIEKGGTEAAEYFLNMPEAPTAMVVTNNAMAIGVYKYLKSHRYKVPEEISVLAYGNIENSELFFIEPGYVTLEPRSIGRKAYQYLVSRIEEKEIKNRESIFQPILHIGESVKKIEC